MVIDVQILREILAEFNGGSTAVSITTATAPKMRKTGNPYFGRVERIARRSGMLGASYENAVNRQRGREESPQAGEFRAESLWGGKGRKVSAALAEHIGTGESYLVFYPTHTGDDGQPIASDDVWTLDGTPIVGETLADVKSYLSGGGSAPKQGVEKQIPWRTVKLDNVRELRMRGEIYSIQ